MATTEEVQHCIDHVKYMVERASPDSPEVSFDYEVPRTLVEEIERLRNEIRLCSGSCRETR